jgi:hypothetical protein
MTKNQIIAEKDGSLTINVNAGEVTLVNKDLTDEEIIEEMKLLPQLISMEDKDFIGFARAILKKAKEK